MITKVFLAAGVASLAIAVPANAERGAKRVQSDERAAKVERSGGRQAAQSAQRVERQARAPRVERQQRVEKQARVERAPRVEHQQVRVAERQSRVERAPRVEAQQRVERQARVERPARTDRQQIRVAERQQVRGNRVERTNERVADRQMVRDNQLARTQGRIDRQALQINRQQQRDVVRADRQVFRDQALAQRWARVDDRIATRQAFRTTRLAALDNRNAAQILAPIEVQRYIGAPVTTVSALTPLVVMPRSVSYLYPDTDDYYYRYGGGYAYRVDRSNNLVNWVLPLLTGGYMPGQYLPANYMNSYAPNYYGLNSFYPDSPYDCNRYVNGVVYQVDCYSGVVEDVIPLYANGYGVGQMLPSSYGYYNVPSQYRSMYYNTPDYNYWYAPGAIYQVDPRSNYITSVAALMTPGLTLGQQLPLGYDAYNVPYGYRTTYYDTPNAWYRYNNGYIYQVDPVSRLVTSIVASILT